MENKSTVNDDINIFADFSFFLSNPLHFVGKCYSVMTGVGFAKYDHYIGSKLFERQPNWFEFIKKKSLNQQNLKKYIAVVIEDRLNRDDHNGLIKDEAERIARKRKYEKSFRMVIDKICDRALPRFDQIYGTRFSYFFVSQVLPRGYQHGMHISKSQVQRLKAKANELASKKQSLILLPSHKSHCDYIALVYVFFYLGLSLPVTIAGDNLDIPIVSWFLRQVGATFIRRGNWKDDPVYVAFFQSLINTYLQQGVNIQCFIEGTRSRTGKLLPPKYGILKFILEAVSSGAVEDCWIVPISTQYDKPLEGDAYASELMGKEKKSENLISFLQSRSLFSTNLGRIDIRISEGFSLRQFITEHMKMKLLNSSILRALAYRVLNDINTISVVMPSALLGTVLLTTNQRSISREETIYRVSELIERISIRGGHIGTISKPVSELKYEEIAHMVDTAIEVLGPNLITVDNDPKRLLETVIYAKDTFKLSYYRNQVVHHFLEESLVCICLYQNYTTKISLELNIEDLKRGFAFLSRVFDGEFIFKTGKSISERVMYALDNLKKEKIIDYYDSKTVIINPQEVSDGWERTQFYAYFIWPFVDGYWSATMALKLLPPGKQPVSLKRFYTVAQQVANTLYIEGALSHSEACNRQVIQSVVSHANSRGFVKVAKNSISLVSEPSDVTKFADMLSLYRKEYINRPFGSRFVTRVEHIGRNLIQDSSKL